MPEWLFAEAYGQVAADVAKGRYKWGDRDCPVRETSDFSKISRSRSTCSSVDRDQVFRCAALGHGRGARQTADSLRPPEDHAGRPCWAEGFAAQLERETFLSDGSGESSAALKTEVTLEAQQAAVVPASWTGVTEILQLPEGPKVRHQSWIAATATNPRREYRPLGPQRPWRRRHRLCAGAADLDAESCEKG